MDELPPFKEMMRFAKDGLYSMHKSLTESDTHTGTDTVSGDDLKSKDYEVDDDSLEARPDIWRPTELHIASRTPEDERFEAALRRKRELEPEPVRAPLPEEEKRRMVDNINANNAEVGLRRPKEMLRPAVPKAPRPPTSAKGSEAEAVANRFIEGS